MKSVKDWKLKTKLTWTCIIVLSLAVFITLTALTILEIFGERQRLIESTQINADITGSKVNASLSFGDTLEAEKILERLGKSSNVLIAQVYNKEREPYVRHEKPGLPFVFDPTSISLAPHATYTKDYLDVMRPIVLDAEHNGSMFLRIGLDELHESIRRSILVALGIGLTALIIAVALLHMLLNRVSKPISDLSETAGAVAANHDYNLRVPEGSTDELGLMASSFNHMLETIQQQNEQLQDQHDRLARAKRMESLGVLAGGVAHDLNNILGPVVGYPELLISELEDDDPMREDLRQIGVSAQRAGVVVQDLLLLARRGNFHPIPQCLNNMVRDYLKSPEFVVRRREHSNVMVSEELSAELRPIRGSAPHLNRAFMNLLFNAMDAMGSNGGTLHVVTEEVTIHEPIDSYETIPANDYVVLRVKDTGSGIPEENLGSLFEPFYSSKKMGHSGSGLGLAVVYGVVRDHEGYVDVKSQVGIGSDFCLYFPICEEEVAEKVVEQHFDADQQVLVLVVDDYDAQRNATCRILEHIGYNTIGAIHGRHAVELASETQFDLVVMDMIMEEDFDGLDAFKALRGIQPELPCIIATGYSESDRVREAMEIGASACVTKPFTKSIMGTAVRDALNSAATLSS